MASPIIVVEREMIKSQAFRSLPAAALVVLMDFLMKRKIKGGRVLNNGEIVYPFCEAQKKGMSPATFNRSRDVLIERGFLDIAHAGSGGKKGDMTLYTISERWQKWGKDGFQEARREKDQRKGVGFNAYWQKKNFGITDDTRTSITDDT